MTSNPHFDGALGGGRSARDHVVALRGQGGTYRSIAQAAGLAPATVHDLAAGRTRPQAATTRLVLAVPASSLAQARADAGGTRLRLRALHVMGHGSARIARALGVSPRTIRVVVRGDAATVSFRLRDAVITVYDAWWDKRAPERTRHERAAATVARRRAIAGNWCAAAALDDDELDRPGYRPGYGWRPARGTGTAPDFPIPVLGRLRRPAGTGGGHE
jgi:predicted transcriptional regulator